MSKQYYKKDKNVGLKKRRIVVRIAGFIIFFIGISTTLYIFAPLILWQIFISPALASQQIFVPIPQSKYITPATIKTLLTSEVNSLSGVDFNDAKNWFPAVQNSSNQPKVSTYTISIPKLNINNAIVSTVDTDLAHHLVQFPGTALPTEKGNDVIIGHSTLPSLYNPKDYKTIFAYAHTLKTGDKILVNIGGIIYTYEIFSITIVEPNNTSIFSQPMDDSYLTIVTCTPPGTIWKRLVLLSRLQGL